MGLTVKETIVRAILKSKRTKMALRVVAMTLSTALAASAADAPPKVETTMGAMDQPVLVTVPVGLSSVLTAPWPVKRVSVPDPKIAEVEAATPKVDLSFGRATGATDIILWNAQEEAWKARVHVEAHRTAIEN